MAEPSVDLQRLRSPSITERLKMLLPCDNDTCCCLPRRSTVIIISIINFAACLMDLMSSGTCMNTYCPVREYVDSVRKVLVNMFQLANCMLLLASIFENAFLVDIYVWFTLGYIVMGFVITIYDFVSKIKIVGPRDSLLTFIPEVIFFFVVFRCLPLVDLYRRHLYSMAALSQGPDQVPVEDKM